MAQGFAVRFDAKIVLDGKTQIVRVDAVNLNQALVIAHQLYGKHLITVHPHLTGDES